jgi:hypothetical protein
MFHVNFSSLFRSKSNKVQPIKTIRVWENKKIINTVQFDDLSKKSNMQKENGNKYKISV